MERSELILLIEQLAAWAADGHPEVERFWTEIAASIAEDVISEQRHQTQPQTKKKAALIFQLTGQAYYDYVKDKAQKTRAEDLANLFEILDKAINAAQAAGKVSEDQAQMVRRINRQVQGESQQAPGPEPTQE